MGIITAPVGKKNGVGWKLMRTPKEERRWFVLNADAHLQNGVENVVKFQDKNTLIATQLGVITKAKDVNTTNPETGTGANARVCPQCGCREGQGVWINRTYGTAGIKMTGTSNARATATVSTIWKPVIDNIEETCLARPWPRTVYSKANSVVTDFTTNAGGIKAATFATPAGRGIRNSGNTRHIGGMQILWS